MRQTDSWLGIPVILIMVMMIVGCSSNQASSELAAGVSSTNTSTGISIVIAGSFLSSNDIQKIKGNLRPNLSIEEALRNSKIVELTAEGTGIQSIQGVTLDPTLHWTVSINGARLDVKNWDTLLKPDDDVSLSIEYIENTKNNKQSETLVITVQGGRLEPELTHTYVRLYTDKVILRDLLRQSGIAVLSDDSKAIKTVKGYSPKLNEEWVLKVNKKQLKASGLDMILNPQDEVQIVLNRL